jgi:sarcosine oxidase
VTSARAGGLRPARRFERRELVVVGGGLLGLSTAHALGEMGHDVVCLEQSRVGGTQSGSRGASRIFRLGYDDSLYVAMALRAAQGWRALEGACGERLLEPCSVLNFGEGLAELMEGMRAAGAGSSELLSGDEVAASFPGLAMSGPAVLDASGGVLRADRALEALRSTMRAELRENLAVTAIEDDGREVAVHTGDGLIVAPVVVVCAGAGSSWLLETAGIECRTVATSEQVAYFGFAEGTDPIPVDPRSLPAVIERVGVGSGGDSAGGVNPDKPRTPDGRVDRLTPGESVEQERRAEYLALYGLPTPKLGWYKLGIHHTGPEVDPAAPAPEPDDAFTERLARAATSIIRGIDPIPRLVERCVYDNTSDGHFVIDRVGRIVIGAGTSGHGFKFGPLLGSILADLATGAQPSVELFRFSARRPAVTGPGRARAPASAAPLPSGRRDPEPPAG